MYVKHGIGQGKKLKCGKGKNMGEMKKQESPCLETITGILDIYNTKDEFDNVETKYH